MNNYVKHSLLYEILSLFGLYTAAFDIRIYGEIVYFKLLIFFKLFRLRKIVKKLEDIFITKIEVKNTVNLLKLFFVMVLIVHSAACVFYGVAKLEFYVLEKKNSWLFSE